jgi:hypothetical protein
MKHTYFLFNVVGAGGDSVGAGLCGKVPSMVKIADPPLFGGKYRLFMVKKQTRPISDFEAYLRIHLVFNNLL